MSGGWEGGAAPVQIWEGGAGGGGPGQGGAGPQARDQDTPVHRRLLTSHNNEGKVGRVEVLVKVGQDLKPGTRILQFTGGCSLRCSDFEM